MKFLIFLLAPFLLFGKTITIDYLETLPNSRAKDFYVYLFLEQNISSNEAFKALKHANTFSPQIKKAWLKKIDDVEVKKEFECFDLPTSKFATADTKCVRIAMNYSNACNVNVKDIPVVIEKIGENSKYVPYMKVFQQKNPFEYLYSMNDDFFLSVFNNSGKYNRKTYFNQVLPLDRVNSFVENSKFSTTASILYSETNLDNFTNSIFDFNTTNINGEGAFSLGMLAITKNRDDLAFKCFTLSAKNSYKRRDKDKALFWSYLISRDVFFLEELTKSYDINFYTMLAYELLEEFPTNIVSSVAHDENANRFLDPSDPFVWIKFTTALYEKSEDEQKEFILKHLTHIDNIPHLAYLLQKIEYKSKAYFVMPYDRYLNGIDDNRKALIYALGRQESYFIPTVVSTSYALGVMQIMPFLTKALAKERGEETDYDEMFIPSKNLEYANHYINYLEKQLIHPLFISYAYNGGITYLINSFKKGLFHDKYRYDPFFTMENISKLETREYGKQVLANYAVYKRLLNEKVSMIELLKNLTPPFKKVEN
ncbi:MAG: transglycosylase SLT domain-containing protein [Campylobacterales bacterium]|nr:transglycosylase SLT domain-containing protein [Campylobacterales bacterium]